MSEYLRRAEWRVDGPAVEQCLDSGKYATHTAAAVLQGAQSFADFQEAIEKLLSSPK
jgi:hypothetical protein